MARRGTDSANSSGQTKIEVFYAKAEGASQSIQDLMRALTHAIGRPTSIPTTARLTGSNGTASAELEPKGEKSLFDPEEEIGVGDEGVETPASHAIAEGPRRRRGAGPKVDRNAGINAASDVDFIPSDKPALRTVFAEKSPSTDMEQVLVICHYLQRVAETAPYGAGHVLGGFRHVGKPIPADLRATLRNMKEKKGWLRFTSVDDLAVTTEGENAVEHDLPRTTSENRK